MASTPFKKSDLGTFGRRYYSGKTAQASYWNLDVPVLIKEFGPIDYIDFSRVEPHNFAVTCSVHVQIYNPITKAGSLNLCHFRENAYGGSFRSDGRLLCAGGEESAVKVFDVETKLNLRVFGGHEKAVRRCFFTNDNVHIASFSDDTTVKLWDLAGEREVTQFSTHNDYIRAGAVSPVSEHILLSGSYDETVCMLDIRTNNKVLQVNHGAPVESVIFLPTGGVFLSSGGTEICVWDAFAGGRLLGKMSQHHKTITCMCLGTGKKHLLSGSLDKHVKIYDLSNYRVVQTLEYPNGVLSLGVSDGDTTVVAGMVDGLVSVAQRVVNKPEKKGNAKQRQAEKTNKTSFRYAPDKYVNVDSIVEDTWSKEISKADLCLRRFEYSKAIDCVLIPVFVKRFPEKAVGVFVELIRRKGLKQSLAGRGDASILTLLKFLIRYISDYRFTRILIDVTNTLLDVYSDELMYQSPAVMQLFRRLAQIMRDEEQLTMDLTGLQGAVQMLMSAESVEDDNRNKNLTATATGLEPSELAKKMLLVDLT